MFARQLPSHSHPHPHPTTMRQALVTLVVFALAAIAIATQQARASPSSSLPLFNARAFKRAAREYSSSPSSRHLFKNELVSLAQDRNEHLREAVSGNNVDTDAVLEIVHALTPAELESLPTEARLLVDEEVVDTEGMVVTMHCMPLPPPELADELGEIETAPREWFGCAGFSS